MSDAPVIKGSDAATAQGIISKRYERGRGETTEKLWRGPWLKAEDKYNAKKLDDTTDVAQLARENQVSGVLRVVEVGDPDDDEVVWTVEAMEISKDLRAHPYFQVSGGILEEIVECDEKIRRGQVYDYSAATFSAQMQRYYGLRVSGVSHYLESGACLRKAVATTRRALIDVAWANANRVVKLRDTDDNDFATPAITPPGEIISNIEALTRLSRTTAESGGLLTPYDDTMYEPAKWEWLKKVPVITIENGGMRYRIEYEWWGAEEWSAVLYGGSWDPPPV